LEKIPTWLPVVALALADARGRWLMHRRPPGKAHAGLWEFPGGKVENGENPVQALVREIEEELAYRLDSETLMPAGFAQEPASVGSPQIVILLYTSLWDGSPLSAREGGDIDWFRPDEIDMLERPPLDVALARGMFEKASH
jgi:8-oxo-dGTP diphosphatase